MSEERSLTELIATLDRRQYDRAAKVTLNGDEYHQLRDAALTARSEGFREGVEAAAKVCYPIIRREQGWEEDNHVALLVEIQNTIRTLSPRETDASAIMSEEDRITGHHAYNAGLNKPAASAPSGEVAEIQQSWKIVAEFFESRNWPDTKLGNAASYLQARLPALLSKVGQTQPDENPPPPERP